MKLSHALIALSAAAMTHAYLAAPRSGFARLMRGGGSVSGSSSSALSGGGPSTATTTTSSSLHMSTQSSSSPIQAMIQSEIDSSKVVVFSKSYCPYCLATKKLFKDMGVKDVKVIELDQRGDGDAIQSALLQMTGQRTVPNTFVNGQHLGGNDKAQAAAKSGELQKKLGL